MKNIFEGFKLPTDALYPIKGARKFTESEKEIVDSVVIRQTPYGKVFCFILVNPNTLDQDQCNIPMDYTFNSNLPHSLDDLYVVTRETDNGDIRRITNVKLIY